MKVAINGFGRIGRLVCRIITKRYPDIKIVAINDLVPPDNLAYLLKYDSVHGLADFDIRSDDSHLFLNHQPVAVFAEKDPSQLPWKSLEVDLVIESTGRFTTLEEAALHLKAGSKKVIITAPAKGNLPTFVMGVNHDKYNPLSDHIVSNASCTTNCLAPLVKVLSDSFGIEEALMTTVHSLTATQPTVDGPSKKDWRGGRSALANIIPSSTGAATAVTLCLPELKGKLTGMAFRVPTLDVSVVDLTVKLSKPTSYEQICHEVQKAANNHMQGILSICEEELVSSDFIGSTYSCILDKKAGISLNSYFYKLIAWYDNEMGYAHRVTDLMNHILSYMK
ncbi:MAG: type I glyceraldehyde-3-phosphate dehydrogenase [Rhabdochlamydiaceae bacterium]